MVDAPKTDLPLVVKEPEKPKGPFAALFLPFVTGADNAWHKGGVTLSHVRAGIEDRIENTKKNVHERKERFDRNRPRNRAEMAAYFRAAGHEVFNRGHLLKFLGCAAVGATARYIMFMSFGAVAFSYGAPAIAVIGLAGIVAGASMGVFREAWRVRDEWKHTPVNSVGIKYETFKNSLLSPESTKRIVASGFVGGVVGILGGFLGSIIVDHHFWFSDHFGHGRGHGGDHGGCCNTTNTHGTPTPTEQPTATPGPTEKPTVTPGPTDKPTVTPDPTEKPTPGPTEKPTPGPTDKPTVTPEPTEKPTVTPEPTEKPTVTPEPTEKPTVTPEPTEKPTVTPGPEDPCDPGIPTVKPPINMTFNP